MSSKVHVYERIWLWAAGIMIAGFLGAIVVSAASHAVQPPSHVETIDPTKVDEDVEFGNPRVETMADGSIRVVAVSRLFSFEPDPIEVPYGTPVTFRITSPDVIHGFQIVGTNANTMVIPGYISQFSVKFPKPGEYLIVCNEYCGLAHHMMQGKVVVTEEVK